MILIFNLFMYVVDIFSFFEEKINFIYLFDFFLKGFFDFFIV